MNKYSYIFTILCLISIFAVGCSNAAPAKNTSKEASTVEAGGVDIDLTALSSTMVYAEVYNMMTNPENYLGKIVKVKGAYYASYFDEAGPYYHYVTIADALECCQQGIEFIWSGDHKLDDYPEDNQSIEITGVFESYEDFGGQYYYLAVDDIHME